MPGTMFCGSRGVEVQRLQELLNKRLNPSPGLKEDAIFGPRTEAAVRRYQDVAGIGVDGVVGTYTWEALEKGRANTAGEQLVALPPCAPNARWLEIARKEVGQRQIAGPIHNPRIVLYHSATSPSATTDEVFWCSAFVNWCLLQVGITGTKSAMARSWLHWGKPVVPMVGAIAIMKGAMGQHHVAFYLKENSRHYELLGGNQSGQVRTSKIDKSTNIALGFRWPNA